MEIITGLIIFIMSISIFGIAYLLKDHLFLIMSATIFILLGLSIFINGLDIKQGFTEIEDNYTKIQTYNYDDYNPLITRGVGLIIIWLGIYISLIGWDLWKKNEEGNLLK